MDDELMIEEGLQPPAGIEPPAGRVSPTARQRERFVGMAAALREPNELTGHQADAVVLVPMRRGELAALEASLWTSHDPVPPDVALRRSLIRDLRTRVHHLDEGATPETALAEGSRALVTAEADRDWVYQVPPRADDRAARADAARWS
uniref:hypothetical protein n=1 Tax=Amycolatopsis sp. CA-290885 TaxID=3239925 RepID=UPI003F49AB94